MPHLDKYKIFDKLFEGVQVVDVHGRYIYVNEALAIQAKRTKAELTGSTMQVEYPGIEHTDIFAAVQQCHTQQMPQKLVTEFDFPDGSKGFFKLALEPVEEGVLILSFDITDIKTAELKIQKANEELELLLSARAAESLRQKKDIEEQQASMATISNFHKAILDNTTDAIVLIGADHKVLCFNTEIQKELFKYFHKNLETGDDYRDFVVEPNRELYLISFEHGMKGETILVENETIDADVAIWFQYKVNPVYDEAGNILGIALTATNIDERKRKEIALRESELKIKEQAEKIISSEKYYRTLIETSFDAVVLLDATGARLYQTPSTERIIGYTLEEVQAINGIELIHPDDREHDEKNFIELIQGPQKIAQQRHRIRHKDGHYIWIDATYRNLLDDETIGAIVLNYHEITDSVNARHQLDERVKELTTIYYVNEILTREWQSAEEILQQLADVLPSGWQYSEVCAAKISFDGQEFVTGNYQPSAFVQSEPILLEDGRNGCIEIVYTENRGQEYEGPFLKEERDLIKAVAKTITVHFNKTSQQKALAKSEANFRSSFEHAAIGMALSTLDCEYLMVNDSLAKLFGCSKEELISLNSEQFSHPDDYEEELELAQQLLDGKREYYRMEKRCITKTGELLWVNINVAIIKGDDGKPAFFVSQLENVTDKVETEHKFRTLVQQSLVGVYIFQDGKFVYVNPAICEESGYTEEELLQLPLNTLVHEDDLPVVQKNIQARLNGEADKLRYEFRAITKQGNIQWYELFGAMTVYKGKPAVIGSMVNITDHKQVLEQLQKSEAEKENMIQDLLQRNNDLQQFAHVVSHNVRGPLSTILGLSSLLNYDVPKDEEKIFLQGIKTSSEKLDMVIRDLNNILQVKRELSEGRVMVDLNELLAGITGSIAQLINDSGAIIEANFAALSQLFTVRTYISNIFYNLITNSIKYSKPGVPPLIKISSQLQEGKIILSFTDNGIGIDMARNKEKLFTLYQRFHFAVEGRGMGLFMTKTQVEVLNGKIEVESEPGAGTTFRVILPE